MAASKRVEKSMAPTKGILKAFIIVLGILFIIVPLYFVTWGVVTAPKFCQTCHEMRPEYVTWQASVHGDVTCVDCHVERKNPLMAVKILANESYLHFRGEVTAPIEIDYDVTSAVCDNCHTIERVVTPPGDLKIPHSVHRANGIDCVKCHSAVTHANIAEDGFTVRRGFDQWTDQVGKSYMRADFLRMKMSDCIDCHNDTGVGPTEECAACHTKFVKPANHLNKDAWLTQHGPLAIKDINACDVCHQKTMTNRDLPISNTNPVVQYARKNNFCAECHISNKPASHGVDWRAVHKGAATQHPEYCQVCHDDGKPTKHSIAAHTGCGACHAPSERHTVDFPTHFYYPFPVGTKIQRMCFTCHPADACLRCHYVP